MNYLKLSIIILIFSSCASNKVNKTKNLSEKYLIVEIKIKNNWNVIYAKSPDKIIKIISKKEKAIDENCDMISIGKVYSFNLELQNGYEKNEDSGIQRPINYLDIQCFSYDSETEICIEPDKDIFELYHTKSLKGLCYIDRLTN